MSTAVVEVPRKKRRARRALVVGLVIVVVLVAGFFVADYYAKRYATAYVRDQVASSLGLPSAAPVTVDLGPGSLLLQAATGSINNVHVSINPIVLDGLSGSATLVAHGVPLNESTPVRSLEIRVSVPTSTVTSALARVPALASLKPMVTFAGRHVVVAGTLSVFGFPQSVGATLTPSASKGVASFTIDTATLDGVTVSKDVLDRYLPGLSTLLQSGTSLCVANELPKAFTLTGIAVRGQSIVSTFRGDGVELNGAALSQKGTCGGG
jgi:hypothetical protein